MNGRVRVVAIGVICHKTRRRGAARRRDGCVSIAVAVVVFVKRKAVYQKGRAVMPPNGSRRGFFDVKLIASRSQTRWNIPRNGT